MYVGLKDSALEPSSAIRHCTELSKLLLQQQISSPILVLFTDGGPDHNNTFLSVQLGLIALFLQHDLNMLEAVRTAPYQLWKNPCERVHSILNLGLQATGVMWAVMEMKFEAAVSNCNSVKEVREAIKQTPCRVGGGIEGFYWACENLVAFCFQSSELEGKVCLSLYVSISALAGDILQCSARAWANNHSKWPLEGYPVQASSPISFHGALLLPKKVCLWGQEVWQIGLPYLQATSSTCRCFQGPAPSAWSSARHASRVQVFWGGLWHNYKLSSIDQAKAGVQGRLMESHSALVPKLPGN